MLAGPLGSGKSTQAQILAEKLGVCLIRMGDLIRERAKVPDEVGKEIAERISQGHLIATPIAAQIIKEELEHPKCAGGFVLDGYPRSMDQYRTFDPKLDVVFYLIVSDEEIKHRLEERQRSDDIPQAVQNRLKWFYDETLQVLEYYEKQGILVRIDAKQPIEKISEEIISFLKNYDQV